LNIHHYDYFVYRSWLVTSSAMKSLICRCQFTVGK